MVVVIQSTAKIRALSETALASLEDNQPGVVKQSWQRVPQHVHVHEPNFDFNSELWSAFEYNVLW